MDDFNLALGLCLLSIGFLFSLALFPRFERKFYPQTQSLLVRSAAPAIFFGMAGSCLAGFTFEMLTTVSLLGSLLVIRHRRLGKTAAVSPS